MSSPTGEPIPGAVPPDISKPPEPIPIPEAPNGGIKVEYRQPDLLYGITKSIVDRGDFRSNQVSNTLIGDGLLGEEWTVISAFGVNIGDRMDGTFHYFSLIRLSEERIARPDHGYYSYEKVRRILNNLEQKGIKAAVDHTRHGGRSSIVIEKDGFYIDIRFGLPNREAQEAEIMGGVEAEKRAGKEGFATKHELPEISRGLRNTWIEICLVNREGAMTGSERFPELRDQTDFTRATVAYTKAYQQVLEAIYAEELLAPPDKTIVLRPPILSSDTLTQIKSVETSSPIVVTPEQLKTEQVAFDEIAGQDAAVAEAKRLVLAINHPEVFEKRGVKRPKGILFYGPPGTGKTLIAKAVATEANAIFLEVSAADIGTKWYGESERLMQKVFDLANDAVGKGQKVVLFFDELDSLAPSREDAHEATRKVVATLLQNMDGMRANPNVTIIAATNRPQDIDPALKRPGRIDKLIQVGLPSTEGRQAILKVHMEKAKRAATASGELFSEGIDFAQIGQATEGMSGADLANLVNLTLEEKTMAELEGREWSLVSTEEMLATAKKLGMIREEKRRMGFIVPERTRQNGPQANSQAGAGK